MAILSMNLKSMPQQFRRSNIYSVSKYFSMLRRRQGQRLTGRYFLCLCVMYKYDVLSLVENYVGLLIEEDRNTMVLLHVVVTNVD